MIYKDEQELFGHSNIKIDDSKVEIKDLGLLIPQELSTIQKIRISFLR